MRDVLGQSWDILQTGVDWMSGRSHEGRPGTVLGHPDIDGRSCVHLWQCMPSLLERTIVHGG